MVIHKGAESRWTDLPPQGLNIRANDQHVVCYSRGSRRGDKNGKGLRHFSMKVCEKVQKKGVTSYNEVADELVTELSSGDNISPNESVSFSPLTSPHYTYNGYTKSTHS